MRAHVVTDVHGNVEALARAAEGADVLVVLGDLLDFVDYADPTGGIVGRVLGPEVSAEFGRIRRAGGDLRTFSLQAWARIPDPAAVIAEAVEEQYARMFAVLPDPTYAIPGNVDVPDLWPVRPGVHVPDGKVVEIGGLRCGFVGGVPLPDGVPPRTGGPWRPNLLPADEYRAAVAGLPELDLLFTHAPPEVPELHYDRVTRRRELPGLGLRARILRDRPRAAVFGHIHQPLAPRGRLGRTECVNAGYFRRTGEPYVLRW